MATGMSNVNVGQAEQFFGNASFGSSNSYDSMAKLFGNPVNPNPVRQLHRHQTTDLPYPQIFEGRSRMLGEVITGLGFSSPTFETTFLLPYVATEAKGWEWDEIQFNTDIATNVPHRGQSRQLTHSRKKFKASSTRRGLSVAHEHDALTTPEGRQHFYLQIVAIANSIQLTACEDVMYALFNFSQAHYTAEISKGMQGVSLEQLVEYEINGFGAIQKDHDIFIRIIRNLEVQIKAAAGQAPDALVVPYGCKDMLKFSDPTKSVYLFKGPAAVSVEIAGAETYQYLAGINTFEMRPTNAYNDTVNVTDQSVRTVTIGEHYPMSSPFASAGYHNQFVYTSAMCNINVYSFPLDRLITLTLRDAIRHCGRFDGVKLSATHDTVVAAMNNLNATVPGYYRAFGTRPGSLSLDPAVIATTNTNTSQIYKVIQFLGDLRHNQAHDWTYEASYASGDALARMLFKDAAARETWERGIDLLNKLDSATAAPVEAGQEGGIPPYARVADFDGLSRGSNPPTEVNIIANNVLVTGLPRYFGSWRGLVTIAKYGSSNANIDTDNINTAKKFVSLWKSIVATIKSTCGGDSNALVAGGGVSRQDAGGGTGTTAEERAFNKLVRPNRAASAVVRRGLGSRSPNEPTFSASTVFFDTLRLQDPNSHYNFAERITEGVIGSLSIDRKIGLLAVLAAPYSKLALESLANNNIPIPFSFLAVRLNMMFKTGSAILMVSGYTGGTGFTGMGDNNFQISHDANTKYVFGHLTLYMKAVVTKRRNVARLENVLVRAYIGGGGTETIKKREELYSVNRPSQSSQYGQNTSNDVMFLMLAYGEAERIPTRLDITGVNQYNYYSAANLQQNVSSLHYSSAMFYFLYYNFGNLLNRTGQFLESNIEGAFYNNTGDRANTRSALGPHYKFNESSRNTSHHVPGRGHFGPYAGSGLVGSCNSNGKMFPRNPVHMIDIPGSFGNTYV